MEDQTIKSLAEELGYSKPFITNRIDQLGLRHRLQKRGNKFIVPVDVADAVRESFTTTMQTKPAGINDDIIRLLQDQLKTKDEQIALLQSENAALVKTLQQTNHLLLTATAVQDHDDDGGAVPAGVVEQRDEPQQPERKGFLNRLFGR